MSAIDGTPLMMPLAFGVFGQGGQWAAADRIDGNITVPLNVEFIAFTLACDGRLKTSAPCLLQIR